jgi:penicillin-binding protein 1C
MALKVAGGSGALTLLVNGVPRTTQQGQRTLFFTPDGPGFARLTVMDARGAVDSVVVRIE